jgi:hypothetical protein
VNVRLGIRKWVLKRKSRPPLRIGEDSTRTYQTRHDNSGSPYSNIKKANRTFRKHDLVVKENKPIPGATGLSCNAQRGDRANTTFNVFGQKPKLEEHLFSTSEGLCQSYQPAGSWQQSKEAYSSGGPRGRYSEIHK